MGFIIIYLTKLFVVFGDFVDGYFNNIIFTIEKKNGVKSMYMGAK